MRAQVARVAGALFYAARSALSSLWAYRLRSSLTAVGVTMGVGTVIAILAIIEGLNTSFREQISMLGTGTLYVSQSPWIMLGDWWKYIGRPQVTKREVAFLDERLAGAKAVVPFVDSRAGVVVGKNKLEGVRVIGSVAEWPVMSGIEPKTGRFFAPGDVSGGRAVVVVGEGVAQHLREQGLALGDNISIGGRPVQVIGTFPQQGQVFGQSQDDFVVVPLPLYERWFGYRRSLMIGVVVDPARLEAATEEIRATMRRARALRPGQEDNFSINQQQMFVELYQQLTASLFATALGLGIITLVVGGVGIMNIMLVAVAERTREIGIRKALGARPGAILLQFMVESAAVSGLGGLAGTLLGLLMSKGVAAWTPLPASPPAAGIVLGLAFGLFVGLVFGFLPAYRASRLLPVEALMQGS